MTKNQSAAAADQPISPLFFQPIQLYLELSDLLIQLVSKLLFLHFFLLVTAREDLGQLIERLFLPLADLIRMDPGGLSAPPHYPLSVLRIVVLR